MNDKTLLILHGKQAANVEVRDAVTARRRQGSQLTVRVTWEGGDAARFAKAGIKAGYQTVIAGGGDGLVREVSQAIADLDVTDVRMAILPLGTANDFASAAGIPDSPCDALALLDHSAHAVDLVDVNGHSFINMATGGFGTDVTTQTSEELKTMLGGAAYFLTGLSRFSEIRPARGRFQGENFTWEGEFLALGLGNARQAGGGQRLCPDALINDGFFDVAILPAQMDLLAGVRELFDSGARQDPQHNGLFIRDRVRELTIQTPEPMNLNLDGEPLENTCFRLRILPAKIQLHLPENSPLLSRQRSEQT